MSKSIIKFTLLILAIVFACSCEKEESEKTPSIYPLNIGNHWTYLDTSYDNGEESTGISERRIQYSHSIANITGFAYRDYIPRYPISLYKNDKEGNLVEYFFDDYTLVFESVFYKKNAQKGDNWKHKFVVYENDYTGNEDYENYRIEEREIKCVVSDTLITTPLDDFHCLGFSYNYSETQEDGDVSITIVQYLSENVGIIKTLFYENKNGETLLFREQTLIECVIK